MNARPLDFGKGFYLTENCEQAKSWAIKKADRFGNQPIITKYEIYLNNLRLKEFKYTDEEWLNFVCGCRKDINICLEKEYDIIIGAVADDTIFRLVTFYEEGTYDLEYTLKQLKINPTYNQLCVCSNEGIARLKYIDSESV
ncbi:MAG: DUF3990 domain-containing protein [Oscillospiraceae bacterium]|nr:DUF3990 domain-containing protein [Oscillospiraceae bacterium]